LMSPPQSKAASAANGASRVAGSMAIGFLLAKE
jgi:hypothetical protein